MEERTGKLAATSESAMLFKGSPERQRETLQKPCYAAEGEGLCGVRWQHCLLIGPVGKWDSARRALHSYQAVALHPAGNMKVRQGREWLLPSVYLQPRGPGPGSKPLPRNPPLTPLQGWHLPLLHATLCTYHWAVTMHSAPNSTSVSSLPHRRCRPEGALQNIRSNGLVLLTRKMRPASPQDGLHLRALEVARPPESHSELALGISHPCKEWSAPFHTSPGEALPGHCLGRRDQEGAEHLGSWETSSLPKAHSRSLPRSGATCSS